MAELHFRLTPSITPHFAAGFQPIAILERSFMATWGRLPRPSRAVLHANTVNGREDNILTIYSDIKNSGTAHVFCPHRQLGMVTLSTETLLPQQSYEPPYLLAKELARGSLGRLLRKLFDWQSMGFQIPSDLRQKTAEISRRFAKGVVADEKELDVECHFWAILSELNDLCLELTRQFTEQSLVWRLKNEKKLPTVLGVGLHEHPFDTLYEFDLYATFLQEAFHLVMPMPSWRELEPEPGNFQWNRMESRFATPARYGFQVVLGPLLPFETSSLPRWLLPRLSEPHFFESRASHFVSTVAERYGSSASAWILANHINSGALAELSITRCVSLIRHLAHQIRTRSAEVPILIGMNQPWSEYALNHPPEFDLLHIAESLLNCQEIDAFLFEMNLGFDSRCTLPRDPMSISDMFEHWGMLGKKVYASFSVPSSARDGFFGKPMPASEEFQWSEGLQQIWTDLLLRILLARRSVHGIFWRQLQDTVANSESMQFLAPDKSFCEGLIDSQRVLKLAFKHFVSLRESVLR